MMQTIIHQLQHNIGQWSGFALAILCGYFAYTITNNLLVALLILVAYSILFARIGKQIQTILQWSQYDPDYQPI